jgi:hypothetical protein
MTRSNPITKHDLDLTMSDFDLVMKLAECKNHIRILRLDYRHNVKYKPEILDTLHSLEEVRVILARELEDRNIAARRVLNILAPKLIRTTSNG